MQTQLRLNLVNKQNIVTITNMTQTHKVIRHTFKLRTYNVIITAVRYTIYTVMPLWV